MAVGPYNEANEPTSENIPACIQQKLDGLKRNTWAGGDERFLSHGCSEASWQRVLKERKLF